MCRTKVNICLPTIRELNRAGAERRGHNGGGRCGARSSDPQSDPLDGTVVPFPAAQVPSPSLEVYERLAEPEQAS